MRVRVYRHLRRLVWSLQDPRTGLVVDHRAELVLVGVALVVSEATRQRVIRQRRRRCAPRRATRQLPPREVPMSPCDHQTFGVTAGVGIVTDDQTGAVVAYMAEIEVKCAACGEPFAFQGVPLGFSTTHPTMRIDGLKLIAPMQPDSRTLTPLDWIAAPRGDG